MAGLNAHVRVGGAAHGGVECPLLGGRGNGLEVINMNGLEVIKK